MRKTKIVCTLGPATDREGILETLVVSGMNVARFNFSHGTHEDHGKRYDAVDALRKKHKLSVATLLDTKGPEIRVGTFKNGPVELVAGSRFTLTTDDIEGDAERVSVSYKGLPADVKEGGTILIDDGLIALKVLSVTVKDIVCEVINGGKVSDRKGVNVPGTEVNMPFLSQKDKSDILYGINKGFDFVAASFTRTASDIIELREFLNGSGGKRIRIIAKIENAQGVANIDDILGVADGVMVARGDMGVEIPTEDVPVVQKMIIKKAILKGKVSITATQMLDSMMVNPRPTRAEAADVANAIFDGSGAVMLSGETASGRYPVEAFKMMDRIAVRTEKEVNYWKRFHNRAEESSDITAAISKAACTVAHELDAKYIVAVTKSGFTAGKIAKYRPGTDIIAFTPSALTCRQLSMEWGVSPVLMDMKEDTSEVLDEALKVLQERGFAEEGELVVMTAGLPIGRTGSTNMVKAQVVGEACT